MTAQATGVERFAAGISDALRDLSLRAGAAVSPRPGRVVQIAPGRAVAWDDCCSGQVWARLVALQPAAAQPARRPGLEPCAVPTFILTVELGIVRCAATVDDRGNAPSPRQITADGQQGINDMAALLGVLRCTPGLRSLERWNPDGPDGGCHGGYWTATLEVHNCLGCEEVSDDPEEE